MDRSLIKLGVSPLLLTFLLYDILGYIRLFFMIGALIGSVFTSAYGSYWGQPSIRIVLSAPEADDPLLWHVRSK